MDLGIVCVFSTSLVRNMCVLVKTSKIGAGLKLVEGVIVEKQRGKLSIFVLFPYFSRKPSSEFFCPDYMIPVTQRGSYNPE